MSGELDPHHHYFPEAGDPAIAPFATVFLRVMFAHAEFEARARELQAIVAGGQLAGPPRKASERPKRMRKLIRERLGEISELANISDCLVQARSILYVPRHIFP